jgi:glycosyltransferase involved in cell wall biosynthesis
MKFGLVVQTPVELGGGHNYESNFVRLFQEICVEQGCASIVLSSIQTKSELNHALHFRSSPLGMALDHLRFNPILRALFSFLGLGRSRLERLATRQGVDILVFASPNHHAPGIRDLPIATTAWDLGHLDLPHASEMSLGGIWAWRESLYQKTLRRSVAVFCDSDFTASRLEAIYGVQAGKIRKIGLLPNIERPSSIEVRSRPFVIYPSMFWPHKNHELLINAFALGIDSGLFDGDLVLTGVGPGENQIKHKVQSLRLADRVKFEGLVTRERLAALIAGSEGVVMPSLLGPSNLPPLEAAILGKPSIISAAHKMEDLIEGGLLVPSESVEDWATALANLFQKKVPNARLREVNERLVLSDWISYMAQAFSPWSRK